MEKTPYVVRLMFAVLVLAGVRYGMEKLLPKTPDYSGLNPNVKQAL